MFIVNIICKGISKDLSPDRNIKGKNEHLIFHSYLFNIILLHIKFTMYSWDEDGEIPLIHVLVLKLGNVEIDEEKNAPKFTRLLT